jgi:hypothetical protein
VVPVVGSTVQYTRRVVPHSGPAPISGGKLVVLAALVLKSEQVGSPGDSPDCYVLDLKIFDRDGEASLARRVMHSALPCVTEGTWTPLPAGHR